jgi:PAS domain S-box-containing protein
LSQVNQAIVMTPTRDELLRKVCQVLVEHGGFKLSWISWNDEATHRLVPVAVWGDETDYVKNIQVYSDERPEGLGPSGRAFRTQQPYICNDLLNEPTTRPWRAAMERRGFRASAVFPIRCQNRVVGTLNVYGDEPDFFQEKEIALLTEAAGDLAFGLDNFVRNDARQRAEDMVRTERDFSTAIINSLPGVLYLYDQSGRFLRWNANLERVTGYAAAELAELHPVDLFIAEDRERIAARIQDVFAQGESSAEAAFLTKDGRVRPYFFTGNAIPFEGRTCLIGVGIDIGARVQAEEAMRASESRYHTLFEQAPDGIVIADAQGNYLEANASICRMLGYPRQELLGLHASDIVVPEETPHIAEALRTLQHRSDYHREWRFRRKDGSTFPADVIATVMPDGNLLGMIRDITARKQAETALRELNENLEHCVAQRTTEMQAAVRRAEAADQIKSAFLATMSHELRTPLNSIIGFTGIVLQGLAGPLNAEQSKQLGMVRGSARHLLELINDVLDISKIEAGQLEVRAEPFELPASIARVTASVQPLAEKKHLALTATVDPALGEMLNDRRRVEQILLNLLNNAIKFTERGGVTLTAERIADYQRSPDEKPGPAVRLRVTDTGLGIKPEDLPKLFQPFRQIDSGLTRSHEGTGLGLAICRRLAVLMGGGISVASEPGQGSVFTVTLPLRKPSTP